MNATGTQKNKDLDYTSNVNYWADRWVQEKIGWHRLNVNKQLIDNLPRLCGDNVSKHFFLPLCGKTVDIAYLYAKGHRVFGVEAVPKAIEDLNAEHLLDLKFNSVSSTYETDNGKIKIYCGNIFTCPFENFGPFDCVWDRGSFVALEYKFRDAYKEMMQRSLKIKEPGASGLYNNFKYLMETLDYNRDKFSGPPRAVDINDMDFFFGDWTNIEVVNREPETIASQPDIGEVHMVHYFLTPKN